MFALGDVTEKGQVPVGEEMCGDPIFRIPDGSVRPLRAVFSPGRSFCHPRLPFLFQVQSGRRKFRNRVTNQFLPAAGKVPASGRIGVHKNSLFVGDKDTVLRNLKYGAKVPLARAQRFFYAFALGDGLHGGNYTEALPASVAKRGPVGSVSGSSLGTMSG